MPLRATTGSGLIFLDRQRGVAVGHRGVAPAHRGGHGREKRRRGLGCDRQAGHRPLHVGLHLRGRLVALLPVLGQCLHHDRVNRGGNSWVDLRRRGCGLPDVGDGDRDKGVTEERRPPGQQLVEHAAGGVEVGARVGGLATRLLRREILRGADHSRGLRHRGTDVAQRAGDAEVHDLDVAVGGDHHVAGLDVAVHDAGAVAVVERVEDAARDLQGPLGRDARVLLQQLTQRLALDELHDDERDTGAVEDVLAGVVDRHDRGVVQHRGGLGLAPEPHLEGGIRGQVGAQHLDRDGAAEPPVAAPAHFGHASAAEHVAQLVAVSEETRLDHRLPFLTITSPAAR